MRSLLVLAFGLSLACAAGTTASTPAASATVPAETVVGGTCSQLTVHRGTVIYSRPDGTSTPVAKLDDTQKLCIDTHEAGFGFYRVRLANGQDGFIAADDLG